MLNIHFLHHDYDPDMQLRFLQLIFLVMACKTTKSCTHYSVNLADVLNTLCSKMSSKRAVEISVCESD